MKRRISTILAVLAAAVIAPALASAITVTITQVHAEVESARSTIVVTLTGSKPASKHSVESIAASARGGIALLFCDLPAGIYSAVVLATE